MGLLAEPAATLECEPTRASGGSKEFEIWNVRLPAVVQTHHLMFRGPSVMKRYTSWDRGEHRREWTALRDIHQCVCDLAPRPIEASLNDCPPTITMSCVPGNQLTDQPSEAELTGVVNAVTRLWAVPHSGLGELSQWSDDLDFARRLTTARRPASGITARAYDAAQLWWRTEDPTLLRRRPALTVLGHRDPNLSNYLWDGRQIWIVDFEDAAVSDPATELAIMSEHLSWRGIDADNFCTRFDVDQTRLLAARRLWAMFWLWLLRPDGLSAARNPPGTADSQARRLLNLLDR